MRIVANDWRDDWKVGNTVTAYKTTKPNGTAFHGSDVVYRVGKRVRPSAASLLSLRRRLTLQAVCPLARYVDEPSFRFEDQELVPTPKPRDRKVCYPGLLHASPTASGAVYYGKLMVDGSIVGGLCRLFRVRGKIAVFGDSSMEFMAKAGFAQLEVLEDLGLTNSIEKWIQYRVV